MVYLCQKPFLLFASSTAPETYKSINYSGAVFLLYSDLNSSSVESFASPVEYPHPHQTGSFELCLFVVLYSSLRVRVGASICVFVFLFVCLLHVDVPVFS